MALQATPAVLAARTLLLLMAPFLQFLGLQATLAMNADRALPWLMPRWVPAPLLQLVALQATPAMVAARTLPAVADASVDGSTALDAARGAAGGVGNDCGSHPAVADASVGPITLAAAGGAAGDPSNDCGSHTAVADGTLAVVCGAAGDPGNDCGSHPAVADGTLAACCSLWRYRRPRR